jgi:hypothetical protein
MPAYLIMCDICMGALDEYVCVSKHVSCVQDLNLLCSYAYIYSIESVRIV